jgi:hypothetical protein
LCFGVTKVVVGLHTLMELVVAMAKVGTDAPVSVSDDAEVVAVEALAPALVGEWCLWLAAALPVLLFLVRPVAAWLTLGVLLLSIS